MPLRTSLPSRLATRLIVAAFAVAVACLAFAAASSAKIERGPAGPKFYDPPNQMPKGHGKLIWRRNGGNANRLEEAASNKLVLYTSKTPQGKRSAVSGLVSVPPGEPPKRGWPVVTWAHGTTGIAESCAPSRVTTASPALPYVTYVVPELNDWIEAGYAVVQTDYQGLGTPGPHAYLIGKAEGRSVLDIVAAARQLNPEIGKRYLIAGHSQGGHAALFAAGMADRWAPSLKHAGTLAYAPASHILQQAQALPAFTSPSGLSGLAAMIIRGAASQTKSIVISQLLSDEALALYPQVDEVCLAELIESDSFGGIAPADLERPGADLGPLYGVLEQQNPAVTTDEPVLVLQGEADTTVFPSFTDSLVSELEALGDTVTYTKYPGVAHAGIPAAAEAEALAFMEQLLPPR